MFVKCRKASLRLGWDLRDLVWHGLAWLGAGPSWNDKWPSFEKLLLEEGNMEAMTCCSPKLFAQTGFSISIRPQTEEKLVEVSAKAIPIKKRLKDWTFHISNEDDRWSKRESLCHRQVQSSDFLCWAPWDVDISFHTFTAGRCTL